jgi:hypothetical protein
MTENIKMARLWYQFHRLTEGHKELILKISEMMVRQEAAVPEKDTVRKAPVKADNKRKGLKKV